VTDLLIKQAVLAQDNVFRQRVEMAMFVAMVAVQGEALGAMTANGGIYTKRQTYSLAVLTNPNAHVDRFAWAVAANSTIAAAIGSPVAISSSTAANPSVITTAAAHGFVNGDTVAIVGHAGNTNANGGWIVTNLTSTTFSIPVFGNGAGTGTGTATKQPTDSDIQFTVNSLVSDFAGVTAQDT
jgi:hypothetical protein